MQQSPWAQRSTLYLGKILRCLGGELNTAEGLRKLPATRVHARLPYASRGQRVPLKNPMSQRQAMDR